MDHYGLSLCVYVYCSHPNLSFTLQSFDANILSYDSILDKDTIMLEEITAQDIKDIREKYGLSQKSFANLLGLGEASIARYEKGHKPSKANANLIRAAKIPRFIMDCLQRDGDVLSAKERDNVQKIVYAEVYFGEGEEEMDMTEMYEITLSQEVLNEKAAMIMAKLFQLRSEARNADDGVRDMIFTDIINQIALLKPSIATFENANSVKLAEIKGRLDGFDSLIERYIPKVA